MAKKLNLIEIVNLGGRYHLSGVGTPGTQKTSLRKNSDFQEEDPTCLKLVPLWCCTQFSAEAMTASQGGTNSKGRWATHISSSPCPLVSLHSQPSEELNRKHVNLKQMRELANNRHKWVHNQCLRCLTFWPGKMTSVGKTTFFQAWRCSFNSRDSHDRRELISKVVLCHTQAMMHTHTHTHV